MRQESGCQPGAARIGGGPKTLGAFYTSAPVADFLVWWAVRSAGEIVLDPAFGGGVFLRAACQRLLELGGHPAAQVYGVEVDSSAFARSAGELAQEFGLPGRNLFAADFFRLAPATLPRASAVVGNPPFIRYQRFARQGRELALERCRAQGVTLPELCSSWAPFLVHSITALRPGGRLAMVLPREIAHARYALPVLDHLRRSFRRTTFLTFRTKLFPELNEDTLLLLAEDKGGYGSGFLWRDLPHAGLLAGVRARGRWALPGARRLDAEAIAEGKQRLIEALLPKKARALYRELRQSPTVRLVGDVADVGIGYVTGANDYFHLTPEEAGQRAIPRRFLKPAVRRGRALSGLRFTPRDWQEAVGSGEAGYLVHIEKDGDLPASVREYLRHGEALGVPGAYKCRTRFPWYHVPHVYRPDAFLSYMSGAVPRLVANEAGATAPNSLHMVRLYPLAALSGQAVAALWLTSLTRLSVEIEGHALGGGMLKLEPTEAGNVAIACPEDAGGPWLPGLADELDAILRKKSDHAARERADAAILRDRIGLSRADCGLLRTASEALRARRYSKGRAP